MQVQNARGSQTSMINSIPLHPHLHQTRSKCLRVLRHASESWRSVATLQLQSSHQLLATDPDQQDGSQTQLIIQSHLSTEESKVVITGSRQAGLCIGALVSTYQADIFCNESGAQPHQKNVLSMPSWVMPKVIVSCLIAPQSL